MAQGAKFNMLLAVKTLGQQGIKRMGNSMQGLAGRVKNVKLTVDGLAKAYVALRVVQDSLNATVQRAESERRLALLSQGFDDLASVTDAATAASKKFGLSQTQANKEFAQIYARLRPIGLELNDIKIVYEGFNTAAKLSGTSSSEASGAFLQLSQALGTGVLRGEEFNSIFEQTPAIIQAIALEMGVPVSQMRDLAKEGKVTIDYILPALQRLRTEGADKLAEAMKGPAQQFKNLKIATEELQIAAIEDNLTTITDGVEALTGSVQLLNKAIKSDEFKNFMDFLRFGGDGNPFDDEKLMTELEINRTRRQSQTMDLSDPETGTIGRRFRPKDIEKATDSLKKLNDEWKKGAQDGLKKYSEGLGDIQTNISTMVVNGFKKMEDALVSFVTKGKLDIKSLVDSIISDLARLAIQQSITKPLFNAFKTALSPAPDPSVGTQLGNMIGSYSSGGYINRPTLGLIGEGGESELVIPQSKLASAMARYQAGARGGAIVPGGNNANGGGGSGYAGGGNVTVNYQGDILNFEGQNYVKQSDVGGIISAAANAGEARTMKTLKNSRSQRAMVGL